MFTPEETKFIVQVFNQLNVNPALPNASETVVMVQGILAKLKPEVKE